MITRIHWILDFGLPVPAQNKFVKVRVIRGKKIL